MKATAVVVGLMGRSAAGLRATPFVRGGALSTHSAFTFGAVAREPPWFVEGVAFKCTECGRCCKTQGDVWLNEAETTAAAEYKG
jgi:hypothetical protein